MESSSCHKVFQTWADDTQCVLERGRHAGPDLHWFRTKGTSQSSPPFAFADLGAGCHGLAIQCHGPRNDSLCGAMAPWPHVTPASEPSSDQPEELESFGMQP